MAIIKATTDTWLKKDFQKQAEDLAAGQKQAVKKGTRYEVTIFDEGDASTEKGGHVEILPEFSSGRWFLYAEHWTLPWQIEVTAPSRQRPEWNEVQWNNWSCNVSDYFTVGEVCNMSQERVPKEKDVKQNIIKIARHMDDIRKWWGGPLAVNSWYRPWTVNRRIGSNAPNHPGGYAVDFRPLGGSVWELQKKFEDEWYNAGRWNGGFGLGARKGFIHLDLRGQRAWTY